MSKQDLVVKMVKAGKSTREQIREAADCTSGALASYLSGMRNAAKYTGDAICPIANDDGILSVDTFENVEAAKAAKVTVKATPKKTPEERLEAAKARIIRTDNLLAKAAERFDENPDNAEFSLRKDLAEINTALASIELAKAEQAFAEAPESDTDDEDVSVGEDGEDELL